MKNLCHFFMSCCYAILTFTNVNAQNQSNTSTVPPYSYNSNSGTALLLKANKDESNNTNENIYMSIGSGNWWNKVKLEVQKEGGVGTRGGMFMDWGHLYLVGDWDNTSTNEHIYFGFGGNTRSTVRKEMILTNSGRLGIGTLSPTEKLHVNGNSKLDGNLDVTGAIVSQHFSSLDFKSFQASSNFGMGSNVFSQFESSSSVTTTNNTAIGLNVLKSLSNSATNYSNTGVGSDALRDLSSGTYNTALGTEALTFLTNAHGNTAIGTRSLFNNRTGSYNVGVGYNALSQVRGSYNTGIGYGADVSGTDAATISNATAIGYNATVTASNTVRIGNSSVTSIGGYANWSTLSDGRFKKNIQEDVPGLEFITKLRPVSYNYDIRSLNSFHNKGTAAKTKQDVLTSKAIQEKEQQVHTGFIAQEVEAAAKEIGYRFSGVDAPKNEGDTYSLRYGDFVVPLVKALQEQQEIIEKIEHQTIGKLESRIVQLEKKLATLKNTTQKVNQLKIFPNPGSGLFNVAIPSLNNTPYSLYVYNESGKLVIKKEQQIGTKTTINISSRPAGVYIVKINTGRHIFSSKLIKH